MLNLSKIQLELERAKEKLRNVEEVIQKIEGKTFPNGPVRYGALKVELHSDKNRNPVPAEDSKNQRRRVIASAVDPRVSRLASDDGNFILKRGLREKRESGVGLKRQSGDGRPQGVFARLSGLPFQQADEEDDDDFVKKPTLPSRVITTTSEAPSRQDVIAAQSVDEQSKQRNRRMFGALVGTLQKFRKEETRVREREEKRLKVEKKLEEDAKREKEKLMQEKRELFMEKKRREIEIKRIEWSLNRVKEYQAWEANVIPLKNFIQTQAKPHIFYLPSLHNSKTEERLAHSQKVVEKMIEKRKINLKEEIENSEKKARKTAAEEVEEEEEAENIPENNEALMAEQQLQVDFKTGNRENGFFEDAKTQAEISESIKENKETDKTEDNWEENCQVQAKDLEPEANNDTEANINKNEENEESLNSDSKVFDTKFININEKRLSGDIEDNEAQINKSDYFSEKDGDQEKLAAGEECEKNKNVADDVNAEVYHEELSEEKVKCEVHVEKSENTIMDYDINEELEKEKQEISGVDENNKTVDENSQNKVAENKAMGESDLNPEDGLKKKFESNTENKTATKSRSREKSRSRKSGRSSRLRKRSQSSKSRRRSTSRRKRSPRKRSRSKSPKNSRKSKSPLSKRSRRNRSPLSKPKRRSSSRSSGSISPKKKRSGSSSSGNSKIN